MCRVSFTWLSSLLTITVLNSQKLTYSHIRYYTEDGLPSTEVYDILQDRNGHMWFATDAGVTRFDGYDFVTYTTRDGLTDNTVFNMYEDPMGRLWFMPMSSRLCYLEDGKIHPYLYNHLLQKSVISSWVFLLKVSPNGDLLFAGRDFYGAISKDGYHFDNSFTHHLGPLDTPRCRKSYHFDNSFTHHPHYLEDHGLGESCAIKVLRCELGEEGSNTYRDLAVSNDSIGGLISPTDLQENRAYKFWFQPVSVKDEIMVLHDLGCALYPNKGLLRDYPDPNNSLPGAIVQVSNGSLWTGHMKGIEVYDDAKHFFEGTTPRTILFEGRRISVLYRDRKGGIWAGIPTEGIAYFPNTQIEVFEFGEDKADSKVYKMSLGKDGAVYCANSAGDLFSIRGNTVTTLVRNSSRFWGTWVSDIYLSDGTAEELGHWGINHAITDDGIHWKANSGGIHAYQSFIDQSPEAVVFSTEPPKKSFHALFKDLDGTLWAGSTMGLHYFDGTGFPMVQDTTAPFRSRIEDIDQLRDSTLVLATREKGLYLWKGNSIEGVSVADGLTSNLSRDVYVDEDENIWLATSKGLNRIYVEEGHYGVRPYTKGHGLPSQEVNKVVVDGDTVYVATKEGVVRFDKHALARDTLPPQVQLTRLRANDLTRDLSAPLALSYDENNVILDFKALSYRHLGQIQYRYRLRGVDADANWQYTSERSFQYLRLSPDAYTIDIEASSLDGVWGGRAKTSLEISPPFWQTIWFFVASGILLLGLTVLLFRIRERRKLRNAEQREALERYKLTALRAQMNPHFIFNTLNSIQEFIATRDFKESNRYLTEFSMLIRTVLDTSGQGTIPLEQELRILRLYLSLERMRFSERFDFRIEVADDIEVDYEDIPPMLVQPFVENAIWHGLGNKEGRGMVRISLSAKGDHLQCVVEDNGVGREVARAMRKERDIQRKSLGMAITQERLDVLGGTREARVQVIDLYDDYGKPAGTRVIVHIPRMA